MSLRAMLREVKQLRSTLPDENLVQPDFLDGFFRMDDPPMQDGNVVGEGMWQHQRDWWNLPNFVKLLVGGYGVGKTISAAKRAIAVSLANARPGKSVCPTGIVSPTFEMARETTVQSILEILEEKRDEWRGRLVFRHVENKKRIHIGFDHLNALIIYYSGEKPDRIKGANLGAGLIDEPFIQELAVFKQVLARVRHPKAVVKEIGLTGTPEGLGWGYELIEGELDPTLSVGFVRAASALNKALDDGFVDRMTAGMSDAEKEAYSEGFFVNLAKGAVYHQFSASENVASMDVPDGAEWGCGMDFNVNPMSFCVFWVFRGHMHIVAEFELPNSDTEFACAVLKDEFPQLQEMYPDPAGKARATNAPAGQSDFSIIQKAGFYVNAHRKHPARRDRYNAVNAKLADRELTIDPGCKKLKRYLSTYTYERMNKEDHKAMSHLLDGTGYAVQYLFPLQGRSGGFIQV